MKTINLLSDQTIYQLLEFLRDKRRHKQLTKADIFYGILRVCFHYNDIPEKILTFQEFIQELQKFQQFNYQRLVPPYIRYNSLFYNDKFKIFSTDGTNNVCYSGHLIFYKGERTIPSPFDLENLTPSLIRYVQFLDMGGDELDMDLVKCLKLVKLKQLELGAQND